MFSTRTGEAAALAQLGGALRREAQKEWPNIAPQDLVAVRSPQELIALVGSRTGRREPEAAAAVRNWMERRGLSRFIQQTRSPPTRQETAWDNEGGSQLWRRPGGTVGA